MSASGPPLDDSLPSNIRNGSPPLASGKSPNQPNSVVGRDPELVRIRDLLDAVRSGTSQTLVIAGEAGIGKTTLLEAAQRTAEGFECLWVRGIESEAVLGYAALLELATPLLQLLDKVPPAQAAALSGALGWATADAPADRFLVAAATLSLLAAAADQRPVLVLVDDAQGLDSESAAALLFAARRLSRDAVAFLFTMRAGTAAPVPFDGLPRLTVRGVSPADAVKILPAETAESVARQLIDATDGHPLALIEVGRSLTLAQLLGAAPLPSPLPVGERLQQVYANLFNGLSAGAWKAVLLCAVSTQDDIATIVRALTAAEFNASAALDEAEERGILVEGVRFRHPLLRSTALGVASPAQRRTAHRSLASALGPRGAREARVWHLAEAQSVADDHLALELEEVAEHYRTRHGFGAASAALVRAANLTSDPHRAAERLACAARYAFVAGDVDRTKSLAERVLAGPATASARGDVLLTLGTLEQYRGSVPRAVELLAAAANEAEGANRVWALAELAQSRFRLNDLVGIVECAQRIDAAADLTDPAQRLLATFTRGVGLFVTGDPGGAFTSLTEVIGYVRHPVLHEDPRLVLYVVLAVGFRGDLSEADVIGGPLLTSVRTRGAVGVLVPLLGLMAAGYAMLGDHDHAFANAGEAAELGEQLGYAADTAVAHAMLAWQHAARGQHDDARRALARARELTDRAETTNAAAYHAIVAAFCAMSRGDLEEVATMLEARIAIDGGVGSMGEPLGVAPLLVEAYVGLGRLVDAADVARQFAEVTQQPAKPATNALIARCRALAGADDSVAVAEFEAALAAHAQSADVTEATYTRLLYGARLRRSGQRVIAREHLRAAMDASIAMGLAAWAKRAAAELAATGATARPRRQLDGEPLTSQETRVALLVAEGHSNREVAAALYLSPKTVEHHLASVFRKRGFRSRTELAKAFAQHPTAQQT